MLKERIDAALLDLDTAIEREKADNAATLASMRAKKAALVEAKKAITPELEAMVLALQKLGFLSRL